MARPLVADDRRRVAARLLERGATPDETREGARWGSKKGEFERRDVGGVEKKVGDKKDYEPKDAVPHLEALVKKWTPKSDEGKEYEKDVLELIKVLGGGKDSDFELTKAERKKGKDWGSKKGEYKRRDVGGVEKKAGDVGRHYKAYED